MRAKKDYLPISIHAPTRGATEYELDHTIPYDISIHAPTRGATFFVKYMYDQTNDFNPRSHERSDSHK